MIILTKRRIKLFFINYKWTLSNNFLWAFFLHPQLTFYPSFWNYDSCGSVKTEDTKYLMAPKHRTQVNMLLTRNVPNTTPGASLIPHQSFQKLIFVALDSSFFFSSWPFQYQHTSSSFSFDQYIDFCVATRNTIFINYSMVQPQANRSDLLHW